MKITINAESGLGKVLLHWWKSLDDDHASRAVLRRANTLTEIALTAPYQRLYQRLLTVGWPANASDCQNDRLAAAVGLLAHVKKHDGRQPPKAMSDGEQPPVSELRFRRLLESPTLEDLFTGLRRVIPLMDSVDVLSFANDVLHWDDGDDAVKKRWAYTYQWPTKAAR